ncbi:MAG: rhodanese-like domain-containing protein [Wenzhouxiangella sp.]
MHRTLIPLLAFFLAGQVQAEDHALSAAEAHAWVGDESRSVLFVDVRDPVEIMFTGWAEGVDINVPFLLVDQQGWNESSGSFPMPRNPDFIAQVDAALAARGLDRDTPIITMCRSGSARGEPSATALREAGFGNVYFVRHGFQGDTVQEGAMAGHRVKNGWQNEGLPWRPRMDGDRIYRPGG